MSAESPIEIYEVVRDTLPESSIKWFLQSELAADPETAAVVEKIHDVYSAAGTDLDDYDVMALQAAYFHRALEVATVDGAPIEDFQQIPGPLGEMDLQILQGYTSRAALKEHCTWGESRAAAAILNMAVRWTDGKSASAWTFDEVRRVLTEDPHDQPLGVAMLRDFDTGRAR